MSGTTEQFGPIPVRAFGDEKLSAADFRLPGAIAYFDHLGRNGATSFVDPLKPTDLAAIDYPHLARPAEWLRDRGHIEIERSATDQRRRIYTVIYNENPEDVATSGDNIDTGSKRAAAHTQKVARVGDNQAEIVANPNRKGIDSAPGSPPKRP